MQTELSYFCTSPRPLFVCFNKIMISSLRVSRAWSYSSLRALMCPVKVRALRGDSIAALPKAVLPGKKLPLKPHFWDFGVRTEGTSFIIPFFAPFLHFCLSWASPKCVIHHRCLFPYPCGEVKPFPEPLGLRCAKRPRTARPQLPLQEQEGREGFLLPKNPRVGSGAPCQQGCEF